jgi:hypothetical protein
MATFLFRVWFVLSLLWLLFVYASRSAWDFPLMQISLWPVIGLGVLFLAIAWIGGSFGYDPRDN